MTIVCILMVSVNCNYGEDIIKNKTHKVLPNDIQEALAKGEAVELKKKTITGSNDLEIESCKSLSLQDCVIEGETLHLVIKGKISGDVVIDHCEFTNALTIGPGVIQGALIIRNNCTFKQGLRITEVNVLKGIKIENVKIHCGIEITDLQSTQLDVSTVVDLSEDDRKDFPDFSMDDFKQSDKIETLCKKIVADYYNVSIQEDTNTLDWLNKLLEVPHFYDILYANLIARAFGSSRYARLVYFYDISYANLIASLNNITFSKNITDLVDKTKDYRNKNFTDLKDHEKYTIKRLNRFLLEKTYPKETPKCENRIFITSVTEIPDCYSVEVIDVELSSTLNFKSMRVPSIYIANCNVESCVIKENSVDAIKLDDVYVNKISHIDFSTIPGGGMKLIESNLGQHVRLNMPYKDEDKSKIELSGTVANFDSLPPASDMLLMLQYGIRKSKNRQTLAMLYRAYEKSGAPYDAKIVRERMLKFDLDNCNSGEKTRLWFLYILTRRDADVLILTLWCSIGLFGFSLMLFLQKWSINKIILDYAGNSQVKAYDLTLSSKIKNAAVASIEGMMPIQHIFGKHRCFGFSYIVYAFLKVASWGVIMLYVRAFTL